MPLNTYIVRPFGVKELTVSSAIMPEWLKSYQVKALAAKDAYHHPPQIFPVRAEHVEARFRFEKPLRNLSTASKGEQKCRDRTPMH
jgi:hypothetical protein